MEPTSHCPQLPEELVRDILYKYHGLKHPLVSIIKPVHKYVHMSLEEWYYEIHDDPAGFDRFESQHVIQETLQYMEHHEPHLYPLPLTDLSNMELRYAGLGFGEFHPYELDNIDLDDDQILDLVKRSKYYRFDVTGIPNTKRSQSKYFSLSTWGGQGWGNEIAFNEDQYWYVFHYQDPYGYCVQSSTDAEKTLKIFIEQLINN